MLQKREVHTRGIVIARRSAGEGSVRVSLYTEELGLVSALATSAREERSKLRPHLMVGTRGTFSLVKGKEVWRLTGAVGAVNTYFELETNDQRESSARVMALIRQFVRGEGHDEGLFESVWEYCAALRGVLGEDVRILEYVTILRILSALGYVAPADDITEFLGAPYSAALIASARERTKDLIRRINDGISVSGL